MKKALQERLTEARINLIKYVQGAEYNIFRVKQIARFGIVLTAGGLFFVFMHYFLTSDQWKWFWPLLTAYFVPPAGKETIIPLGINRGIPFQIWGLSIWAFDLMVAGAILTNWWVVKIIIKYVKIVDRWTQKLQKRVEKLQEKKYGKYLPLVLLIFMWIPIQGSGAVTTSFIGTWLGLKPRNIFLMVAVGSGFSIIAIILLYFQVVGLW